MYLLYSVQSVFANFQITTLQTWFLNIKLWRKNYVCKLKQVYLKFALQKKLWNVCVKHSCNLSKREHSRHKLKSRDWCLQNAKLFTWFVARFQQCFCCEHQHLNLAITKNYKFATFLTCPLLFLKKWIRKAKRDSVRFFKQMQSIPPILIWTTARATVSKSKCYWFLLIISQKAKNRTCLREMQRKC